MLYKLCRSWFQKVKKSHIMSSGQKWARFDKEYIPYDWTSETKIWLIGGSRGDLLVRKGILKNINFLLSYNMLKNVS